MGQKSKFFAGDPMPEYTQEEIEEFYKTFNTNGVFAGQYQALEVIEKDPPDMAVVVQKGKAFVEGFWYFEDATAGALYAIDTAHVSNPRIDRIVLRLTKDAVPHGNIEVVVLKGTPGVTPAPPELTQNNSVWEISLAQVYVGAGVTSINDGNITDEREMVESTVAAPPMRMIFVQEEEPTEFSDYDLWFKIPAE